MLGPDKFFILLRIILLFDFFLMFMVFLQNHIQIRFFFSRGSIQSKSHFLFLGWRQPADCCDVSQEIFRQLQVYCMSQNDVHNLGSTAQFLIFKIQVYNKHGAAADCFSRVGKVRMVTVAPKTIRNGKLCTEFLDGIQQKRAWLYISISPPHTHASQCYYSSWHHRFIDIDYNN